MSAAPPSLSPPRAAPARAFWPQAAATLLLLVPLAAWVTAYFWANSTPGRAAAAEWLLGRAPAGRLSLGDLHWGPRPDDVLLIDFAIVDPAGRPLVTATSVQARVDLVALAEGDLVVDDVRAVDFSLHLAWDDEGQLNLARALARERAPGSASAPGRRRRVHLRRIALDGGAVTLEWPRWGLQFEHVRATGAVETGAAPLAIHADLRAGASHVVWEGGAENAHARGVDIAGFHWAGDGFDVDRLAIAGADGSGVDLAGSLELSGDLALRIEGDAALGPEVAEVALGPLLPDGARVHDMTLSLAGTTMTGRAQRLEAPTLSAGPLTVRGIDAPIDELTFVPGLLKPTGAVALHDVRAARIEGPGLVADGVSLGRAALALRAQSTATLSDLDVRALQLEGRLTTAVHGHLEATFGLTSGTFEAAVATDSGRIEASGTVRLSPLTKKLKVAMRVAADRVGDRVAAYLQSYLPAAEAAALAPPLDGFALFETTLSKEKPEEGGAKRWIARTSLTEARLTGGGELIYDGSAWATVPTPSAPSP